MQQVNIKARTIGLLALAFLAVFCVSPPARAENPCSGVDRSLNKKAASAIAPVVAKQLGAEHAEISQSFLYRGWSVFYASTGDADDTYVFYSGDPLRDKYVTLWGGAATQDEEPEILHWILKNAPGIPLPLARCFAWHVTKEP